MTDPTTHIQLMREALAEADRAAALGEVPVGAIVVHDGAIIGRGHNQPIGGHDPTAHAEVIALRAAANAARNYRLTGATVYVTVEPCLMCLGALRHARIGTLVYGSPEPRNGVIESNRLIFQRDSTERMVVISGVLANECRGRLQDFFRAKRDKDETTSQQAEARGEESEERGRDRS